MSRTTAHWITSSGESDWTIGSNWDIDTAPTAADDAHFDGTGYYQVDITSAVEAYALETQAPHFVFDESSAGAITAHSALFGRGTIILDGTNDLGSVDISSATVEVGADDALGRHAVSFDEYGGSIEAVADVTLHNVINMNDGFLAAAAGDTLVLDGDMNGIPIGTLLGFGSLDGSATGTVELDGLSYTPGANDDTQITIYSGTVSAGKGAHSGEANELLAAVGTLYMDHGTTLDLTNFSSTVAMGALQGFGTIENNGGTKTIDLSYANFNGSITGRIDLDVTGTDTFIGDLGTVGYTTITMGAGTDDLDIGSAWGKFEIYAPSGSDATIDIGDASIYGIRTDHFMDFENGDLTVDTEFAANAKISWVDNSNNGGVVRLVVHNGHGTPDNELYFYGVSSHDGFVLGNDGHGHLQITYNASAEDSEAHAAAAQAAFVPLPHDVL